MAFDWKKMKLSKDSKVREELKGLLGEKHGAVKSLKKGKKSAQDDWLNDLDRKIKEKNDSLF